MNTLYIPCLSNYFMKFLLIKKKKNSVWLKRKHSVPTKGKTVLCPVYACARVCVSISQRMVSAVFRQNDFFLRM